MRLKRHYFLWFLLFQQLALGCLFSQESTIAPEKQIDFQVDQGGSEVVPLNAGASLNWKSWLMIAILLLTIGALILELRPPDITMLISSGILVIIGILPPKEFLSGFSEDIIMTIAMLCIVVRTIEIHGMIDVFAKFILSTSKNVAKQLFSLMIPVAGASAFLNNTPIVLLMTPIVRRWSIHNGTAPSKYLIPLSYAAILGGFCTIIGTSTNLVIEGLIRQENPKVQLSFFELSYVGIPCAIAGIIFMTFIGRHLLPLRKDPLSLIEEDIRDFTVELLVEEGCPLAGKPVFQTDLRPEALIQVERDDRCIYAPSSNFVIRVGDRLVFAGGIRYVAELHAIPGLRSLADPHFKLDPSSLHFSEIVISSTSLMVGKTVKRLNFRSVYGASVLAIYREGERIKSNLPNTALEAGDTLMLLSSEEWHGGDYYNKDYYCLRVNERLQVFNKKRCLFILAVLFAMIALATIGFSIMVASMAAVAVFIFTRTITIREAQNSIVWGVLLLIVCSFAFAKALVITGVAYNAAYLVLSIVGSNPYFLIGGILAVTIISTEFLSNNASALILFPIALQMARLAGYEDPEAIKTVGVAIALGASCGFAMPTGYQTHMIVFGEGGYKFLDFIKVGVLMDVLIWVIGLLVIPHVWPLYLSS